ncbi:MAG: hypothetical protein K2O40_11735 [Lachnospiraceae bacterium]|nr:hypothetical protein [Lachnospiraceae bacterium]
MKPINVGGHSAYQNRVLTQLLKYYPDAATSLSSSACNKNLSNAVHPPKEKPQKPKGKEEKAACQAKPFLMPGLF